ncbi:hypothetical protein GXE40_24270 [Escherichia coli]|nr:hypothetical protein [Escherichia coli]
MRVLTRFHEAAQLRGLFCVRRDRRTYKTPDDVHQAFYRQKSVNLYQN